MSDAIRTTYAGRVENLLTELDHMYHAALNNEDYYINENLVNWTTNEIQEERRAIYDDLQEIFDYQYKLSNCGANLTRLQHELHDAVEDIKASKLSPEKEDAEINSLNATYLNYFRKECKIVESAEKGAISALNDINNSAKALYSPKVFSRELIQTRTADVTNKLTGQFAYIGDRLTKTLQIGRTDFGKTLNADHFDITMNIARSAKLILRNNERLDDEERRMAQKLGHFTQGKIENSMDLVIVKGYPVTMPIQTEARWMDFIEDETGKHIQQSVVVGFSPTHEKNEKGRENIYILKDNWLDLINNKTPLLEGDISYKDNVIPGGGRFADVTGRVKHILKDIYGYNEALPSEQKEAVFISVLRNKALTTQKMQEYFNICVNSNAKRPERQRVYKNDRETVGRLSDELNKGKHIKAHSITTPTL